MSKTAATTIQPETIPSDLKILNHWLGWRYETRKADKPTKVPKTIGGGSGSSTDPATWTDFETARREMELRGWDGLGFAGMEKTPYTGIDLDHCLNPETGEINPAALRIVQRLDSYTEITPGGDGLRVWVEADKHKTWSKNKTTDLEIEVYTAGRFFTVTGNHLAGTPAGIESRQAALDWFMGRYAPKESPWDKIERKPSPFFTSDAPSIDLEAFLEEHGVEILRTRDDRGAAGAYSIVCPWVDEHTDGDTSGTRVGQYADGPVWFHCDHGHCGGRKWRQFREYFEPGCYEPRWVKAVASSG